MGTARRVPALWVGCKVPTQLLRSPSAPLNKDPHPTIPDLGAANTSGASAEEDAAREPQVQPLTGNPPAQATTLILA